MSDIRTVSMLAKLVGVSVPTIRFYERQGLLGRSERAAAGHYDDRSLQTLRYIRIAQQAGCSLKQIRNLQQELPADEDFLTALQFILRSKLASLAEEAARIARLQTTLRVFLARSGDPIGSPRDHEVGGDDAAR